MQHLTLNGAMGIRWLTPWLWLLCAGVAGAGVLHDAAIKGDIVRMQSIIDQQPQSVGETNADGDTPLHSAALTGQNMGVQFLLANGADVNARNNLSGSTPLLAAAMMGHRTVVEILLAAGANVNQASTQGTTPLHVAAYQGHRPMIEFLLARGSNVNLKDQTGLMPVQWALLAGHKEVARVLLLADPELQADPAVPVARAPVPDDREAGKLREQILALTRALRDAERGRQTAQQELERTAIIHAEMVRRLQDDLDTTRRERQQAVDDLTMRLTQAGARIAEMERSISLLVNQAQTADAEGPAQEMALLKGRLAAITMAMKEAEINRQTVYTEVVHLKAVLAQMRVGLRQLQDVPPAP